VTEPDPEALREQQLERWERAAAGWGRRSADIRVYGMPVSMWMIQHLWLQPGQRVLELAAGPGDTGLLAAELIRPGGTLVSSDAASAMLDVARERAVQMGIDNVEFRQLELEWIDLPTGSVDAVLCRWGVMLVVDREAAAREMRRVLRPGGRVALAVWDDPSINPWATIPRQALMARSQAGPPQAGAPDMFALAAPGALADLLESAGFTEVAIDAIELPRTYPNIGDYLEETCDLSQVFADALRALPDSEQTELVNEIESLAAPFANADGSISFPGRSLVAAAGA
jgi:ubiquinone/menaquinone biosynthesis C-methylase UbiE